MDKTFDKAIIVTYLNVYPEHLRKTIAVLSIPYLLTDAIALEILTLEKQGTSFLEHVKEHFGQYIHRGESGLWHFDKTFREAAIEYLGDTSEVFKDVCMILWHRTALLRLSRDEVREDEQELFLELLHLQLQVPQFRKQAIEHLQRLHKIDSKKTVNIPLYFEEANVTEEEIQEVESPARDAFGVLLSEYPDSCPYCQTRGRIGLNFVGIYDRANPYAREDGLTFMCYECSETF